MTTPAAPVHDPRSPRSAATADRSREQSRASVLADHRASTESHRELATVVQSASRSAVVQRLSKDEQDGIREEMQVCRGELRQANDAKLVAKLKYRIEQLLEREFDPDNQIDAALQAEVIGLIDDATQVLSALSKSAPAPTSAATSERKKADPGMFAFLGPAASSSSKVVIDKKATVAKGKWTVDFGKQAEPEMAPAEYQKFMHQNFEIDASADSVARATEIAKHAGSVALGDDTVGPLRAERVKGSKSLQGGIGDQEKVREANVGWNIAEAMVRSIAERVRGGAFPTSDVLLRLLVATNAFLTPGSTKSGKFRDEARGGGLMPPELIATEVPAYCTWLSSELGRLRMGKANAIVLASQAYQRLNTIHAFGDGNGRVCQMMMDFVLQCGSLLPASLSGALIEPMPADKQPTPGTQKLPTKALDTVTDGVRASYSIAGKHAPKASVPPTAPEAVDLKTETGRAKSMLRDARTFRDQVFDTYVVGTSPSHMMLHAVLEEYGKSLERRVASAHSTLRYIAEFTAKAQTRSRDMSAHLENNAADAREALVILAECGRLYDTARELVQRFAAQKRARDDTER